jgi:hypothetical protein
VIERINDGHNSTNSEKTNPDRRAIRIHGGMEQNLVKYANTTFVEVDKY